MPSRQPDPVRVYLDSSDISNLSDPDKLAANTSLQEARKEIIDFGQRGVAEFRFSFFHIVELAHLDPEHKPKAEARVQLVKLLCGNHAYLHPEKLRRFEALSLARDGKPETTRGAKARAYVDDASWLPDSIAAVASRFTEALIRGLNNRIVKETNKVLEETGQNRATRRAMKRKFANRRGATREAVQIAAKTADAFLGDWERVYPLTKRFWNDKMLFQFLEKEISKEQLHRECLNGFADAENFIGWCVDKIPSIRTLPQAIRSTEQAVLFDQLRSEADQRLEIAREILEELDLKPQTRERVLQSLQKDLQDAVSPDPNKTRRQELEELYQSNRAFFTSHRVNEKDFETRVMASPLGAVPSVDAFLHVIRAHFKKLAKLSDNPPKLRGSDLSDLLHCAYVPYANIFSADKRTRDLITEAAAEYGTELVVGTPALLEAIRSKAKSGE